MVKEYRLDRLSQAPISKRFARGCSLLRVALKTPLTGWTRLDRILFIQGRAA